MLRQIKKDHRIRLWKNSAVDVRTLIASAAIAEDIDMLLEIDRKGLEARYVLLRTLQAGWAYIRIVERASIEIELRE